MAPDLDLFQKMASIKTRDLDHLLTSTKTKVNIIMNARTPEAGNPPTPTLDLGTTKIKNINKEIETLVKGIINLIKITKIIKIIEGIRTTDIKMLKKEEGQEKRTKR